jgi:RimJ/RimL family protein N-acetyltransferase
MPGPAFTRGESVSLHPIEPEDYEFVQRERQHPSARVPLSASQIRTREEIAERFGETEYHYLVCLNDGGEGSERVGGVALTRADGVSGNLTYWIARDHRGQGYVTEATELLLDFVFRECGFHKVTANTYVSNEPSVRTLESLGFEREGCLREAGLVDGEFEDMFEYSVLQREWLAR